MSLQMIQNIRNYYLQATDWERANGLTWYDNAYYDCHKLASIYDVPVFSVVGMVAALSPRNRWERNVTDTEQVILHGWDATVCTFRTNLGKAVQILEGSNPTKVLHGNKVLAFFYCINNHWTTRKVCVDSHTYNVAVNAGERGHVPTISDRVYDEIVEAYQTVASELGILPHQLQATNWLTFKRIHGI